MNNEELTVIYFVVHAYACVLTENSQLNFLPFKLLVKVNWKENNYIDKGK